MATFLGLCGPRPSALICYPELCEFQTLEGKVQMKLGGCMGEGPGLGPGGQQPGVRRAGMCSCGPEAGVRSQGETRCPACKEGQVPARTASLESTQWTGLLA